MRLFVCVRPPAHAVAHLLAALPSGRWGEQRWHVTLSFLGEVDDPEPVRDALAQVRSPPLELSLAGSGTFGRGGPVWVGLAGDLDGLHRLAGEVRSRCGGDDRPYRPHLTVGRRGRPDRHALADYAGPVWTADVVELVRSHLGRTVHHEVLARHPLTAEP